MSIETKPLNDQQLAEFKRLHAAATKGKLRVVGHRLSHESNRQIDQTVFHLDEIGQLGTGPYQAIPFARREDAEWHAALHNEVPALLARLEAAEREREAIQIELDEERENSVGFEKDCRTALTTLATRMGFEWDCDGSTADALLEHIWQTVEAAERERDERTTMAARAQEALRYVMNGLPTNDAVWAAYGNADSARAWLSARDAQQRREGASKWLGGYLQGLSAGNPGAPGSMVAILEAELKRLREGGE